MIALDPDFVGSLAPPTKLTTAVNDKHGILFARLPRLERLRAQGKADDREIDGIDSEKDDISHPVLKNKREATKKMRGKDKALKR